MEQTARIKYLKIALNVIGALFIVGLPAMMMWIWPAGWGWTPPQPEYEHMILGVYATLGIFLIIAARDPLANVSLIWFTIWYSIVHGSVMLIHAIIDETDRVNLVGDVPALFVFAFVLWKLTPKKSDLTAVSAKD